MIMMKKDKEKLKVKVFEDRNHLIEELDRVFSQKSALITFIDDFRNKLKAPLSYPLNNLDDVAKVSIDKSTIRAFHTGKYFPPLQTYHSWAANKLKEDFVKIQSIDSFDFMMEYIISAGYELGRFWRVKLENYSEHNRFKSTAVMDIGRAAKLYSLTVKHLLLLQDDFLTVEKKQQLSKVLTVPLDKFTLQAIRKIFPDLNIRKDSSMGFVSDESVFRDIQARIKDLVAPNYDPFDYEILVWNITHT